MASKSLLFTNRNISFAITKVREFSADFNDKILQLNGKFWW